METRIDNKRTGDIHFGTMEPKIDPAVMERLDRDGKTGNFPRDYPEPGSEEAKRQTERVHAMIARDRLAFEKRLGLSVDTGEMPVAAPGSIKDHLNQQQDTLDYVLKQKDVDAMNKLSRKVGAITSSGDASGKEWKKCVNAELAKGQCSGGRDIGVRIPVDGCRLSHGYDPDKEIPRQGFLVPDSIKAPMTDSNKIAYTEQYGRLKNIVASNDGPDHMDNVDHAREFAGKTARCELYGLDTNKGGRKTRGRKRGRKTRGKKRVKKTRTKRKHVKKVRSRKRGRKTHGRKMSKKRGTRKRSYRKRR